MIDDNLRLGQVWSCIDSIEVIVGWFDRPSLHRTFIIMRSEKIHSPYDDRMFDVVKESQLADCENGKSSNWKRIA